MVGRMLVTLPILLLYGSCSSLSYEDQWKAIWFIGAFFLNAALSRWLCRISWTEAFYCSINGVFTEHLASSTYIFLFTRWGSLAWISVQYYAINLVVYVLVYLMVARQLSDEGHYAIGSLTVFFSSVAGLGVAILLSMQVKVNADVEVTFTIENLEMARLFQFCQIYAICFCVLMLVLQVLQHRDLVTQKKMAVNQTLWEQRQIQYQISKENIDLINRKCHDMKHQVAALMQVGGDSLQRERFVEDVQRMIEIYDSAPDTGNEVLNTILAQRSLYCNMHNIQWSCMADGTVLTFMENIDLYTLMGNALDNAVKSVEKLSDPKQRRIDLQIGQREAFVVIQLQNPFYGTVKIKNGLPVTSKEDRQNHGFGVRSIRSIAEKYQGSASVRTENGVFVLNVVIPMPKQE